MLQRSKADWRTGKSREPGIALCPNVKSAAGGRSYRRSVMPKRVYRILVDYRWLLPSRAGFDSLWAHWS